MSSLTISWSALRAHTECRQKAYLLRSGRRMHSDNIRKFFHGTVVDRVMRSWLMDDSREPGQMAAMVSDVMDHEELEALATGDGVVRWRNSTDRAEVLDFCTELVRRLEPLLYDLVVPYEFEPARRFRTPFQIPYLTGEPTWIWLAGEWDVLVRDNRPRFNLWDLKGTADDTYWRKTIGQLVFYDLCVHSLFGEYCDRLGLIQPMCRNPLPEIRVTVQLRTELIARIIRMAHDMWIKDVEPKQSTTGCQWCQVRNACSKFQPVGPGRGRVSLVL